MNRQEELAVEIVTDAVKLAQGWKSLLIRYMGSVLLAEGVSFRPEEPDRWFTQANIDDLQGVEAAAVRWLDSTSAQRIEDARRRLNGEPE